MPLFLIVGDLDHVGEVFARFLYYKVIDLSI